MDNIILTEAFKELKLLEEEAFDIDSPTGVDDAKEYLEDEIVDDTLDVADVYAEEEEEVLDSYIGQVVLDCNVCHSKIFEDPDKVEIDEESQTANMEEECPYCFSMDGYKVIGQVAPMGQVEEEIEVEEEPIDDETVEDIGSEVPEEEEVTEDEIVEESLNECGKFKKGKCRNDALKEGDSCPECGKNPCECKGGLHESVSHVDAHYIIKFDTEEEALAARDKLRGRNFICDIYPDNYIEVVGDAASDSVKAAILDELGLSESALEEDFKDVSITTDDSHMTMTSDEDGKVTVTTEPVNDIAEDEFVEDEIDNGEEMLAPVDDETVAEIKDEVVDEPLEDEEPVEDEVEDIDIDEFDEEGFDELGESYLKKVYENVNSFKTTGIKEIKNKLCVEGLINFKSGNTKKTSFLFEAKDVDSKGKIRFIGENKEITRGKKSFTVAGRMRGKKFMCESLNYNYRAKDEKGKSTRLYGTIKRA